jgi:hypothetical protein
VKANLRELREAQGVDQTFQNLLRALTLNLELRSRYRVFEFEAAQDGHAEVAELFRTLRGLASEQTASLTSGLQAHLNELDPGASAGP